MNTRRFLTGLVLISAVAFASAQSSVAAQTAPDLGPNLSAQSAADYIREFAGADGAFLAGGLIKDSFSKDNLATMLLFPTDDVVIVSLTGAQVRQALERSVSLLPQPNPSFLQLSGFEATYSRSAAPGSRITNVTAGGTKIDETRTYTVAMPSSLAKGGLGYFKIWDKSKITKTFASTTIEDVLKGKKAVDGAPRWSSAG